MERGFEHSPRCRHFSLFYVVFLFSTTFLMIHFMQYNPDDKVPSFVNFKEVVKDEEPTRKPLPVYDFNSLPSCSFSRRIANPRVNLTDVNSKFQKCAFPLLARYFSNHEGLMSQWQSSLYICDDEPSIRDIELRDIAEDKWAILPACKEKNTLVTLGVSEKTRAEDWLVGKIPNLKMYGTDSFLKSSKRYTNFWNFGLSEGAKKITIEVEEEGELVNRTVHAKGVKEFFENDLKLKKIDMLWINPTYGNFPFWSYLQMDDEFQKMEIDICQMIIDMPKHMGDQWNQMIQPMEKDSKFVFMRPTKLKNGSIRTFFVNIKDPQCTRKYLE